MSRDYKLVIIIIMTTILAVSGVVLIERINAEYNDRQLKERNEKIKQQLALLRFELESALINDIYLTSTLGDIAVLDFDTREQTLVKLSNSVIERSDNLTSLGFAKNDIINFVYPYKANSKAIGKAYRDIPKQWETVKQARLLKQIIVAGPTNLIQGGRALIVRVPVFYDHPINNNYWGVVSGVINYDKLFGGIKSMDYFNQRNLSIVNNHDGDFSTDLIFGHDISTSDDLLHEVVRLPYGSWSIYYSGNVINHFQKNKVRYIAYPLLFCFLALFVYTAILYITNEHRANHDALTRIPNRRYLVKKSTKLFKEASKDKSRCTLLIVSIDVDKFKLINDTYGHAAGDMVLKVLSRRIQSNIRKSDIVARIGGDEFIILMRVKKEKLQIGDKLDELVDLVTREPIVFGDANIPVSISAGYAVYDTSMQNIYDLLIQADKSMYVKKQG
ncbi:Diguanylate cyclase DosC [Vibrio scophthalmi]|uniref:diguanylate cyclase n=2 Tax=Vibrio scophthalmi TaxID=45658 RepID=A0A1C7FE67_9VIBR|nr:Diguanylate cyclase DosC [Vibrio scophthalmi]